MEDNFFCPTCKKFHTIPQYSYNAVIYTYKNSRKQIVCDCSAGTPLESVPKKFDGFPAIGKIASMTPTQRGEVLKKRSAAHFKKELAEKKHEFNKQFHKEIKTMGS